MIRFVAITRVIISIVLVAEIILPLLPAGGLVMA